MKLFHFLPVQSSESDKKQKQRRFPDCEGHARGGSWQQRRPQHWPRRCQGLFWPFPPSDPSDSFDIDRLKSGLLKKTRFFLLLKTLTFFHPAPLCGRGSPNKMRLFPQLVTRTDPVVDGGPDRLIGHRADGLETAVVPLLVSKYLGTNVTMSKKTQFKMPWHR